MNATAEFWSRVDASLDARRDPFSDPEIARVLLEQPERLAELEALMASLDGLSALPDSATPLDAATLPDTATLPDAATPPARWERYAAAAVVLCTLGAFAWWLLPADADAQRHTDTHADSGAQPGTRDASGPLDPDSRIDLAPKPYVPPPPRARIVEFSSSVRHTRSDSPQRAPRSLGGQRLTAAKTPHTPSRSAEITWRHTWTAP